jgi:hypothetical protein
VQTTWPLTAPVAWRLAYLCSRETGEPVTTDALEHAMLLVVNDHDDIIISLGRG